MKVPDCSSLKAWRSSCLGVHHDGAIPRDRLLERLAGDQQEANAFGAGLDYDLVAAVEEHERMVFRVVDRLRIGIDWPTR